MAGGSATQRRERDKSRASFMKARGIVRTTGRCGCCYASITVDSPKSRFTHTCFTKRG